MENAICVVCSSIDKSNDNPLNWRRSEGQSSGGCSYLIVFVLLLVAGVGRRRAWVRRGRLHGLGLVGDVRRLRRVVHSDLLHQDALLLRSADLSLLLDRDAGIVDAHVLDSLLSDHLRVRQLPAESDQV